MCSDGAKGNTGGGAAWWMYRMGHAQNGACADRVGAEWSVIRREDHSNPSVDEDHYFAN